MKRTLISITTAMVFAMLALLALPDCGIGDCTPGDASLCGLLCPNNCPATQKTWTCGLMGNGGVVWAANTPTTPPYPNSPSYIGVLLYTMAQATGDACPCATTFCEAPTLLEEGVLLDVTAAYAKVGESVPGLRVKGPISPIQINCDDLFSPDQCAQPKEAPCAMLGDACGEGAPCCKPPEVPESAMLVCSGLSATGETCCRNEGASCTSDIECCNMGPGDGTPGSVCGIGNSIDDADQTHIGTCCGPPGQYCDLSQQGAASSCCSGSCYEIPGVTDSMIGRCDAL